MSRTTQRLIFKSLGVLSMSLLCLVLVHAQEFRAVISGQVTDPQGAVIPNVTITALREGTQQPYAVQTNSGGNFSIPYLLPGVYSITAEAPDSRKRSEQA